MHLHYVNIHCNNNKKAQVLIGETLTSLCGMTIHGKGLKRIRWHRIHDSRRGIFCSPRT